MARKSTPPSKETILHEYVRKVADELDYIADALMILQKTSIAGNTATVRAIIQEIQEQAQNVAKRSQELLQPTERKTG